MKINLILMLFLFILSPLIHAQDSLQVIDKMKKEYEKTKEASLKLFDQYKEVKERNLKNLEDSESKLRAFQNEKKKLTKSLDQFDIKLNSFISYSKKGLENLSFAQKITSRKKNFYNCILENIERLKYPNTKSCLNLYPAKFSTEEKLIINDYAIFLPSAKTKIESDVDKLTKDIERYEQSIKSYGGSVNTYTTLMESENNKILNLDSKLSTFEALKKEKDLLNCSPGMKTVDLEEEYIFEGSSKKGPFYKVPRDNQDGVGSCYANAAKNLYVSLTGGEVVPSFLDMALQYKKKVTYSSLKNGLDGGNACPTLEAVKEFGVCDQKYAPAETGESNEFISGLLKDSPSVGGQLAVLNHLKAFLHSKDELSSADFFPAFIKNPKELIERLEADPDITFPLPIVNDIFKWNYELEQSFYVVNKDPSKEVIEKHKADKENLMIEFKPKLIRMIIDGATLDEILDSFEGPLLEFLKRWGLQDYKDKILRVYKNQSDSNFTEENKRKLFKSVRFLQELTESKDIPAQSFIASCFQKLQSSFDFLDKLNPLIKDVNKINNASDVLLGDDGDFKDVADLTQLAVAPSCLNQANRRKVDFNFSCSGGASTVRSLKSDFTPEEKLTAYRVKIAQNLLQGFAVGNEIAYYGGSIADHINTIVGLRYNSESGKCEYKIRESQNGRSAWHDENKVVDDMLGMVEVSR